MCFMNIDNYSAKELKKIFEKQVSTGAYAFKDKWKGYRSLVKQYHIAQIESNHGLNFNTLYAMHIM